MTCSAASTAAGEPLGGTAPRVDACLLIEVRGPWERDAIDSLAGPAAAAALTWLEATPRSRLLLIRRPDRREGDLAAFVVQAAETSPSIRRFALSGHDDLAAVDLARGGEPVDEPLALVCGHGRRDACCARLGVPLYEALRPHAGPGSPWLSSHQGGHRFAPNLLWLPDGLSFGRVDPASVGSLLAELGAGRLPLKSFRGRVTAPPEAQAAEIAVRERFSLSRLADVTLLSAEGGQVSFTSVRGTVEVDVATEQGPPLPASCGGEPEPVARYVVSRMRP